MTIFKGKVSFRKKTLRNWLMETDGKAGIGVPSDMEKSQGEWSENKNQSIWISM